MNAVTSQLLNGGADIGPLQIHIPYPYDVGDILGKQTVAFLTFPQRILHLLPASDIPDCTDPASALGLFVVKWYYGMLAGKERFIFPLHHEIIQMKESLLSDARIKLFLELLQRGSIDMQELSCTALHFLTSIAEYPLGSGVAVDDDWGDVGIQDENAAAPTLNTVRLDRGEARELFDRVILNLNLLLQNERIHGDLSAYNILYWDGDI